MGKIAEYANDTTKKGIEATKDKTPKEAGMKLLRRPFRPKEYFVYEMKKYSLKEQMYWRQWCYKTA